MMGKTFDVIVDLSGKIGYQTARTILKKNGVYVSTLPGPLEMIRSLFSRGRYKLLVLKPSATDLKNLQRPAYRSS